MSTEILSSVLRGLMEHEARTLTSSQLANLEVLYRRAGEDRVKQFSLDSSVNQLPYSRHKEKRGKKLVMRLKQLRKIITYNLSKLLLLKNQLKKK